MTLYLGIRFILVSDVGHVKWRDRVKARAIADVRLRQVEQKIAELGGIRDALRHLVHACREGTTLECPILESLEHADARDHK